MAKAGSSANDDLVHTAADAISDTYDGAQEWVEDEFEGLRERIRDKPIRSALIAAGIGLVLSRIFL